MKDVYGFMKFGIKYFLVMLYNNSFMWYCVLVFDGLINIIIIMIFIVNFYIK